MKAVIVLSGEGKTIWVGGGGYEVGINIIWTNERTLSQWLPLERE